MAPPPLPLPLPAAVVESVVRLAPPLRPPEMVAPDATVAPDKGVEAEVVAVGVVAGVPVEPEPVEAVDVVVAVGVVPALVVAQLAVDKADTTVDCCPSGFLVAFR